MATDPRGRHVPGPLAWTVLALVLAALLALFLWQRTQPSAEAARTPADAPGAAVPAKAEPAPRPQAPEAAAKVAAAKAAAETDRTERIDAARRVVLLAAIAKALEERSHVRSGAPAAPPQAVGHLDKEYLRARIHELVPLIRECYELALDADPSVEGTVKVRFTVIGDEALGGVIEDSEIVDGTAAADPTLSECVRETMYGLRLKAPEGGGRVTVTYPFRFSHADGRTDGGSG